MEAQIFPFDNQAPDSNNILQKFLMYDDHGNLKTRLGTD